MFDDNEDDGYPPCDFCGYKEDELRYHDWAEQYLCDSCFDDADADQRLEYDDELDDEWADDDEF